MLCFRLADAQSSIQSRKGAIFFILRFTMFINVLGQLMLFPMEMPIFQRESQAHLYGSGPFFLAKNIAELPGQIIFPIIFMSIAYWMIGFQDNGDRFMAATGVLLLITSAAASMGYFLSTLSTSLRGVAEAGSNILTTLMLFDGFLINSGTIPPYMRWLGDISIYKWSYEALSIVIWENFPIGCLPSEVCQFTNGNQVLDSLSFSASDFGLDIGMLFASIVGYRLLSYLFVFLHGRRKPKPA
jgi:ABC-type multidrug transport system permease subunit